MKTNLKEVTPTPMRCIIGGCPAVFKDVTPKTMNCVIGGCPVIHSTEKNYFIIGEKVNPKDFGLDKKVGNNEVLVKVPKKLIDDKEE
ncbi:MAG: hypothetical protein PHD81_02415 [Candidatus Nanoarchaeia archaeon]|nr:hypothetical protein [Candidatus Nanoarchaeia archaeon]MDD5587940.1 hypothetical protein [Candidatus Nanoarchaeia archaeon]